MRVPRKAVLGPNSKFHKIWRAHNREFLMQDHAEKRRYVETIREDHAARCTDPDPERPPRRERTVKSVPPHERFRLFSYCVMSNHVHETGQTGSRLQPLSDHMRRAHGRFGQAYNKRHGRIGKVACDRPRTLQLQDDDSLMRAMLYGDCNPVRAGLIPHPTDIRWRGLSSCRFYAFGERSPGADMLTPPEWYLRLGKTPRQRQARYRALLDQYLIDSGLKRDPSLSSGFYFGGATWVEAMRKQLRELLRRIDRGPP